MSFLTPAVVILVSHKALWSLLKMGFGSWSLGGYSWRIGNPVSLGILLMWKFLKIMFISSFNVWPCTDLLSCPFYMLQ